MNFTQTCFGEKASHNTTHYSMKSIYKYLTAFGLFFLLTQLFSACMQMRTKPKKFYKAFEGKNHQPQLKTYTVNEQTVHYAEVGNPELPTVVMVHGAPGSLDAYIEYLKDDNLLNKARLISVDRPGYGYSDFGKSEVSIEEQAACLKPLLESDQSGKVILVGHSYGGPIIARLAMDYPDLVDGLIMVAPAIDPDNERVFWISYPIDFFLIKWMVPKPFRVSNDEKLSHADELRKMVPLWKNITVPTTLMQGGKDWIVLPVNADFGEKMLVNAPLNLIRDPEWNHFILWSEIDLIKADILKHIEGGYKE